MTPRLSPERLAQISAIPDHDYYMRIHPKPWLGNELRDLLHELREVTRERDEAREEHEIWKRMAERMKIERDKLKQERDEAQRRLKELGGDSMERLIELANERDKLKQEPG